MRYSIDFLFDAKLDLAEAMEWYDQQKQGLGDKLLLRVENTVDLLESNPFIFQIRYKNIRVGSVKKFPFAIHYWVDEKRNKVMINAVLHNSRNPQIWKDRS